jgi:2-C-methyl-D-erythritol 4-phosphate cytidylyltransferase
MKCSVIIVGAGEGKRIGGRKLLMEVGGRPMVLWTLEPFLESPDVCETVLVVHHRDRERCEELMAGVNENIRVVTGGRERQDSVFEGLKVLKDKGNVVVIHDAARPFVTTDILHSVIGKAGRNVVGAIAALPARETIKRVVNGKVVKTLRRKLIWSVQTPQAFPADMLFRAYELAMKDGYYSTDDAALCERLGYHVEVVEGDPLNIKITSSEDLLLAEMILRSRGNRLE